MSLQEPFMDNVSQYSMSPQVYLQHLLGMAKALYNTLSTAHWQINGNDSYGNHTMLQRLYESMPEEIDALGEKMVAKFGEESVESVKIQEIVQKWTKRWSIHNNLLEKALKAEKDFQFALKTTYEELKKSNEMSLGLDDFIMSMANDHETHIYLLQQASKNKEGIQ